MVQQTAPAASYQGPLHEMTQTTPTCLWTDTAEYEALQTSLGYGAVGATCNPVIAVSVLKKEMAYWRPRAEELIRSLPHASEDEIGWKLVEEMSVRAAGLLRHVFERDRGRNGRLSIQTDPRFHRDPQRLLEQAVHFSQLAPNMIVKIPVTAAGIPAIEEATYRGVSINATVSFTLPQALSVAEAVERGLKRREKEGKRVDDMGPVCTLMVGRLDDWLKMVIEKEGLSLDPGACEWAGVAVFKKAYQLYRQRGYRLRLLAAAYRNHMHWSELVGGDLVLSPPFSWQSRFNKSGISPRPRIEAPLEPRLLHDLLRLPDFRRAYEEDGLSLADFDSFPPTRRTLRQFLSAGAELNALVRDFLVKNPD
ncbi:MAG TPA: transaldolase family protein [Anaeromyxobacter sp.]|nr:transaldolase family protein [Anaeromyxobacter sp.]